MPALLPDVEIRMTSPCMAAATPMKSSADADADSVIVLLATIARNSPLIFVMGGETPSNVRFKVVFLKHMVNPNQL
jgi:hypothetical protein